MARLVLSILFLFSSLCAFADAPQKPLPKPEPTLDAPKEAPSLVNMTAMPSSIVNGSVNVISGHYCIAGVDHTLSGPAPFTLGHSYFSASLKEGTLGNGWNFFHHHKLEVFQPGKIIFKIGAPFDTSEDASDDEIEEDSRQSEFFLAEEAGEAYVDTSSDSDSCPSQTETPHVYIGAEAGHHNAGRRDRIDDTPYYPRDPSLFVYLVEPMGGKVAFKGSGEHYKIRDLEIITKNTGFTNVSGREISGQTNIKNIKPKWDKEHDRWVVTFGDGTERRYERQWNAYDEVKKHPKRVAYYRDYQLTKETLPSGNIVVYNYNKKREITEVRCFNKDASHKLGWIKFKQKSPGEFAKVPSLHVKTSDDQEIKYYFKKLKGSDRDGVYAVSGIKKPGQFYERFKYCDTSSHHKRRVYKHEYKNGYYNETHYYRVAENKMGSKTVKPKNKEQRDFLRNRVRMQYAPVGPKEERVLTHRYFYYKDKGKKSGHCTVRDAYNNITRYYWNGSKRLTKIESHSPSPDDKLLKKETFTWGTGKLQGYLLARTLYDENNHPIFSRAFEYDKRGNITKESVYGRFTSDSGNLKIDSDGMPDKDSTCDKLSTHYTYSDDGFNLKTSECDPLGNYIYYDYYKESNLLKSKFTCDGKKTKKREFYSYDKNGQLEELIVDDGSDDKKNNLKDVTERHITTYKRRHELPHFGEPTEVAEYYYDLDQKKEVLLKRTVNTYSKKGFLSKKKIYDRDNKLTSTTEYDHNDTGLVIYTKDSLGREEHFTYDDASRLIKKRGPRDDVTWEYVYTLSGKLKSETEIRDGITLTTQYDYDLLGRKIAVTNPQGNTTRYEYDSLDRVTKVISPTIFDHQGNAITPTKSYTYEKLGTRVTETDENGYSTRTDYNAQGKPFAKYLPDGTIWYYHYDKAGNLERQVAPNHLRTLTEFDCFNRPTSVKLESKDGNFKSETNFKYNTFHLLEELSPTNELVITEYDGAGRKMKTILTAPKSSLQRITIYHYDALSRLEETRTHLENHAYTAIQYSYDALDRVVSETLTDHKGRIHSQKQISYDLEGNVAELTTLIMGKLATTKTSYHAHGLIKEQTNAEGHTTKHFYDYAFCNIHHQTVLKKTVIDPMGVQHIEVFDTRGNSSCTFKLDPFGNTLCKQELYYDAANNLIRTRDHSIYDFKTEKLITNTFSYGPQHRLEQIIEALDTPEQKTTTYTYNAYGEKEKVIHADGTTLNHTYDYKGRLKEFYASDNSLHYDYAYDLSDKITSVTDRLTDQFTKRRYNELGDLISETLENGLKLTFNYDTGGRLSILTLPDNSQVDYRYSPALLQSVSRNDWTYEITSRDNSGLIISATLPHQAGIITYDYDKLGRRIFTSHPAFNEQATAFDSVGNLLHIKRNDFECHYTYDFLSQLATECDHDFHFYSYDSLYNRRGCDRMPYTLNSLHSVLSDGTRTFTYDKRANCTSSPTTKYRYDALDRLIEAETDATRITYSYDAFNRRMQKQTFTKSPLGYTSSHLEKYLYHLENEIGSTDSQNNIKELRILAEGLGAEIGATIAIELQNTLFIPLNDRRGNIVALLDPTNTKPLTTYRYDAFGNETPDLAPSTNPWRFSSKRVDPESGLVYFGRRYYDPTLGRWLTHDPLGLKAGPNLYAYVHNNPLTLFDLYGLEPLRADVGPGLHGHPADLHNQGFREHYESQGFTFHYGKQDDKAFQRVISISYGTKKFPGVSVMLVNGLNMSFKRCLDMTQYVSNLKDGMKVELVYDPAQGTLGPGLMAGLQRAFNIESQAERNLLERFDQLKAKHGNEEKFVVIGYSRGAIQLNNAIHRLPEDQRQSVIGVGLCPAKILMPRDFAKAQNILNEDRFRDCVPYTDSSGWEDSIKNYPSMEHITYCKSPPEVKERFDHAYDSRTYRTALVESLNRNIHDHMRQQ